MALVVLVVVLALFELCVLRVGVVVLRLVCAGSGQANAKASTMKTNRLNIVARLLIHDIFKEFVGIHFLVFGRNRGPCGPVTGIIK